LDVEDTGKGILEKDLAFIFGRFYRADDVKADSSGSGLGLAIAHQVISLHGGLLTVQSTSGQGSRFTIELPQRSTTPP
jgi:signal transduction histidine kinase